jgi:hypothetical protein
VGLYVLFFLVCFFRCKRWWQLILILCLSRVVLELHLFAWSRGIFAFFTGGLTYLLFNHLWRRGFSRFFVLGLIFTTALAWLAIPLNFLNHSFYWMYETSGWRERLLMGHRDVLGGFLRTGTEVSLDLILFPLTILTLAICEVFRGTLGGRMAWLGHISYSVYLLHFPLQLILVYIIRACRIPNTIFYSPGALLGFFSVLIPVSLASFYYFEHPIQNLLRAKLLPRSSAGPRNQEGHTQEFPNQILAEVR